MIHIINIIFNIVWRLFTGQFVHLDFFNLLFSVISYVPSSIVEENQIGTVPFTIRFFKNSFVINSMFCTIGIFLHLVGIDAAYYEPCLGLWPILICDIVI